jgi:hypothetical protein
MYIADRYHYIQSVQSVEPSKSLARLEYTVKVDEVLTEPGVKVDISTLGLISVEGVCLFQCRLRCSQPVHRQVRRDCRKRRLSLRGIVQVTRVCHGLVHRRQRSFPGTVTHLRHGFACWFVGGACVVPRLHEVLC